MIGILLVTHGNLGMELITQLEHVTGAQTRIDTMPVRDSDDFLTTAEAIGARIDELDSGDGVVMLVDLVGCTPCNQARKAARGRRVRLVTGANLPMLIRLAQERKRGVDLDAATASAVEAGRKYISVLSFPAFETARS